MDTNTRVFVAAAAARIMSGGGDVRSVYDYYQSRHIPISGSVKGDLVSLYDNERSCGFSGSSSRLYDNCCNSQVLLSISGKTFTGYDLGNGHHFKGSVIVNAVAIYDYGESSHFNYLV